MALFSADSYISPKSGRLEHVLWRWLADNGIDARLRAGGQADLLLESHTVRVQIKMHARAPRPSEPLPVVSPDQRVLFVTADRISRRQAARFDEVGWWYICANRSHVAHIQAAPESLTETAQVEPARWPVAKSRLIHTLLITHLAGEERPDFQQRLASDAAVTQAYVSKVLTQLRKDRKIDDPRHMSRDQWRGLADEWLYRRTWDAVTTHWYSLASSAATLGPLLDVLPDDAVLSGDFSADRQAPWRQPTTLVALATDIDHMGSLVPSATAEEATVTVHVTSDPVAIPAHAATAAFGRRHKKVRLADPLQTAWDMAQHPGSDTEAAIDHLLNTVTASRWPT